MKWTIDSGQLTVAEAALAAPFTKNQCGTKSYVNNCQLSIVNCQLIGCGGAA